MVITIATQIILDQNKKNVDKSVHFHDKDVDKPFIEYVDFFESRHYNQNIVDIQVQTTADVFKLTLYIYQNNSGKIQVLK